MPGLLLDAMEPPAPAPAKGLHSYGFVVSHQKVELDVDFATQSLKGRTEITILPQEKKLDAINIDARQCKIHLRDILVNNVKAVASYEDPLETLNIPDYIKWTASQYKMQQDRLPDEDTRAEGYLQISRPLSVHIKEVDPFSDKAATPVTQRAIGASFARGSSLALNDPQSATSIFTPKTAAEQASNFQPLVITIPFSVEKFRDGLHFVGMEEGDSRYPHIYTRHSMDPGTASCIFPCIDDPAMRCTWEISIRCSRTLGDALKRKPEANQKSHSHHHHHHKKANGIVNGANGICLPEESQIPLSDEEKLLDMAVICSGELMNENVDLEDSSKKIVSFLCGTLVAAQHIGFAVGPFEQVDLGAEFREEVDDEKLGQGQALPVWGYCLPGRTDELKNTCMNVVHTVDWYVLTFGSFPFSEAKFVFVDDQIRDVEHTASLSLCSSRLLYPEDIIDPERETMRKLAHALASQYIGVGTVPNESSDRWVTIGLSHFMAGLYMKHRCGNNDYLFRQKTDSDRLVELDVRRPPLTALGSILHLGPFEYDFMALKAPLVLFILDKRIIKATGSAGLTRVISKLVIGANTSGDSVLTTESFRKSVEKITKYRQTDPFWQQWILGSSCPRFRITQKFNKKRSCIEMTIQQFQSDPVTGINESKPIPKHDFLREFKEEEIDAGEVQNCFTGPMTIRIHEADGTPYEHIVEIRTQHEKIEIPYATKYKRLKRTRRQRERVNASQAVDLTGEGGDDALYYCLGDVLQSQEDIIAWDLRDWDENLQQEMDNENYEWFRIDADFEWLCSKDLVRMPSYMYISQLQQDRDVVAHQEAMLYLKSANPHPLVSTFCIRTLMDTRYNYNIRLMAADVLRYQAVPEHGWIGLRHLEKAYTEFFCYPNSKTPRPNDFSNIPAYLVSKGITAAVAQIRGHDRKCPKNARDFVLDQLRFNDNQNNEFSDNFKVAELLVALTDSVIPRKKGKDEVLFDDDDEFDDEPKQFLKLVIEELDRHRRMDEWINSYQNIYTTTVLRCKLKLMKVGVIPVNPVEFAKYIHDGTFDLVRLTAFESLLDLGFISNNEVIAYLVNILSTDHSPFVRSRLFEIFCLGLAVVALGDGHEEQGQSLVKAEPDDLEVVTEVSTEHRKAHQIRTTTIIGALAGLKQDMGSNVVLKESLWKAVKSPELTLAEQASLLEICGILYDPVESMQVVLRLPRYWEAEHLGKGKIRFHQLNKVRTKPLKPRKQLAAPAVQPHPQPQPPPQPQPSLSVTLPTPTPPPPPPPPPAVVVVVKPSHTIKLSMGPPSTTKSLKRPLLADDNTIHIDSPAPRPRKMIKLSYNKYNAQKVRAILDSPPQPKKAAQKGHRGSVSSSPAPVPRQSPAISLPSPARTQSSASPAPSHYSAPPAPLPSPVVAASPAAPVKARKPLPDSVPICVPPKQVTKPATKHPVEKQKKSLILKFSLPRFPKIEPQS
ncbi:hypothetical protein B0O99DRAFT_597447 [Bisporella sp. PMI_857]|nr:hypothetical protein B0O99DRAFT_597447 [Bisporella sp. PMI_857]